MTNELFTPLYQIQEKHDGAFVDIPNELFQQLSEGIVEVTNKKDVRPLAFALGYVALTSFLYKYAHYLYRVETSEDYPTGIKTVQVSELKAMLGYHPLTKTIDFIVKKNGVLDNLGITEATQDVPIYMVGGNYKVESNQRPTFYYVTNEELYEEGFKDYLLSVQKRYYEAKKPLFFFERNYEGITEGTLVETKKTTRITIDELLYFLTNDQLELVDLLVYLFLKKRAKGINDREFMISYKRIKQELLLSKDTFYKTTQRLSEVGVVLSSYSTEEPNAEIRHFNVYRFIGVPPLN